MSDLQHEGAHINEGGRSPHSPADAIRSADLSYPAVLLAATNTADLLSWLPALAEDLNKYLSTTKGAVGFLTCDGDGERLLDPLSTVLAATTCTVISSTPSGWYSFCRADDDTGWTRVESEALEPLLSLLRTGAEFSVPIVSVVADAKAIATVDVYAQVNIYVGSDELECKHNNTVPLTGQGVTGAHNFVRYLLTPQRPPLIRFRDLPIFAERSQRFYSAVDAPAIMRQRAIVAADVIFEEYPKVQAIFGTGYPFYVSDGDRGDPTPTSILRYLRAQRAYFRSKVCPDAAFERHSEEVMTPRDLRVLGLRAGRGRFDRFWYDKFLAPHPPPPQERATLREHHRRNAFDRERDLWPCELCTHLQDVYLYPDQQRRRGFNEECLARIIHQQRAQRRSGHSQVLVF